MGGVVGAHLQAAHHRAHLVEYRTSRRTGAHLQLLQPHAVAGETSLWRRPNDPVGWDGVPVAGDEDVRPSRWSAAGVDAAIAACRDPELRARALAFDELPRRAAEILVIRSYAASAFHNFRPL